LRVAARARRGANPAGTADSEHHATGLRADIDPVVTAFHGDGKIRLRTEQSCDQTGVEHVRTSL